MDVDQNPLIGTGAGMFQTNIEADTAVVIGRDLQQAIDQLLAVPSLTVWNSVKPTPCDIVATNHHRERATHDVNEHLLQSTTTTTTTQSPLSTHHDVIESDVATSQTDDVSETDSTTDETTDDNSKYAVTWNIRRLRKHRLDPTGYKRSRDYRPAPSAAAEAAAAAAPSGGERKPAVVCSSSLESRASDESLDSVVERILENDDDVIIAKLHQLSSSARPEVATRGGDELNDDTATMRPAPSPRGSADVQVDAIDLTLDVNRRHVVVVCCGSDREPETRTGCDDSQTTTTTTVDGNGLPSRSADHNGVVECRRSATGGGGGGGVGARPEVTLEDLFEQAVESLADDDDDGRVNDEVVGTVAARAAATRREKQYRGEENWERRVYDDELHRQCHQYRLHGYSVATGADYARVSRGFALVEKVDKSSQQTTNVQQQQQPAAALDVVCNNDAEQPETSSRTGKAEAESDARSATTYRHRTVISASLDPAASCQSEQQMDDVGGGAEDYVRKLDVGVLESGGAAVQHGGGGDLSRSSSVTWDTISVDSCVVLDDDSATVRAIYSATTHSDVIDRVTTPTNELIELNGAAGWLAVDDRTTGRPEELVNGKEFPVGAATSSSSAARRPEPVAVVDSSSQRSDLARPDDEDDVTVLTDSLTTQTLVLNVKLPTNVWKNRNRSSTTRPQSAPAAAAARHRRSRGVPYRELRVRREIRLSDLDLCPPHPTSSSSNRKQLKNDGVDDGANRGGGSASVVFTSLRPSDLMTSLPVETEVEYETRKSTSGTEPALGGGVDVQLVGVERSDAVRQLVVRGRQVSDFRYEPTSLRLLVDGVKEALAVTSLGGKITCHGVESKRVNNAPATVVGDYVVDCLNNL